MQSVESGRSPQVTVVGHITEDLIGGELRPGGSALYCALALAALDAEVRLVSRMGPDTEVVRAMLEAAGVACALHESANTTRFRLEYPENAQRRMWLERRAGFLALPDVPDDWRNPDLLLIVPVIGEVQAGVWLGCSPAVLAFGIQGWLKTASEDGRVVNCPWVAWSEMGSPDLVSMSDEDLVAAPGLLEDLGGSAKTVMLTRGKHGCTVFSPKAEHRVPALLVSAGDPTGAGDTFLAVASWALSLGLPPLEAAIAGNAAASVVVEGPGITPLRRLGDELDERVGQVRERMGLP